MPTSSLIHLDFKENIPHSLMPIDLVYLWCDGADTNFSIEKRARMLEVCPSTNEENTGDSRYIQHDELRYSLRSVCRNIPWVRHIFIVTNKQRPSWLKMHPKISIIDHSEIIPRELLPTFSSPCIELFLNRIPGLSEHFLYTNDDVFFFSPLHPSDFFDSEGKPIVWLSRTDVHKMTESIALDILSDDSRHDWKKTLVRAWMCYQNSHKRKIPFYTPAHSVDAYTKTLFQKIMDTYPELQESNTNPFRTGDEISRLLFSFELIGSFSCKTSFNKKPNFWARLCNSVHPSEMISIVRPSIKKMERDLKIFTPKTFCLNNLSNESELDIHTFLEKLFPSVAPWEIYK